MRDELKIFFGFTAAVGIAFWIYASFPNAGIVVFLATAIAAVVFSLAWVIRREKGPTPKNIWKALWDFFWGM